MKIGMTLPTMARGYTRDTTVAWCRQIDAGPYASLSAGERITYHNQEQLVILSAAAALTERVRVIATIVILPMHPVPLVAKQAATLDVLSAGRFTLGLGVGGREPRLPDRRHDRSTAGCPGWTNRWRRSGACGRARRRSRAPIRWGRLSCRPAGHHCGAARSVRSRWRGIALGRRVRRIHRRGRPGRSCETTAATVRQAWQDSGRTVAPYLMGGGWFSLGPDAAERHRAYVEEYVRIDPSMSFMADVATIVGEDHLRATLDNAEAAGYDEFMLVPTTVDLAELDRVEAVLDQR